MAKRKARQPMPRRNYRTNRKEKKGKGYFLRMGQLFGPYSVGAIYPCDANTTVMIAGLDEYGGQIENNRLSEVHDARLKQYIGVSRLYSPPIEDGRGAGFVPAVRFPNWLYCPRCGQMRHIGLTNSSNSLLCESCSKKYRHDVGLVPERFVVVCPHGHIDSLPVMKWVHKGEDHDPNDPGHVVYRHTRGGSTTMGDIEYRCSCGVHRSLKGINTPEGLNGIGYHCAGSQPWLVRKIKRPCPVNNRDLRVVIMGATNVCYPDVVSSVLIPDALDEHVKAVADEQFSNMEEMERRGSLDSVLEMLATACKVDSEALRLAYRQKKTASVTGVSDTEYLHDEFLTLRDPHVSKKGEFVGKAVEVFEYRSSLIQQYFSRVSLIETLTVTRALVGFTRLNPEYNDSKTMSERRRILSRQKLDWTLANQAIGEGVFLEFDASRIEDWCLRPEVGERIKLMQDRLDESRQRRNLSLKTLNPRFVAIHTLSHLLLLGISEICGYAAASLRERIYCQMFLEEDGNEEFDDMHGVLIYTASASGDGSLGGLVRSGEPGRFEDILRVALEKATWCSDDPVCIESTGQGLDSCNLAACYNCALVPETACENGNRFLDRGLVVGTVQELQVGLFGSDLSTS
ncbi:DUF1998 domain-containing protein [Slackia exigua]|uniref:DUF1998 domain-containing protein n=1 Tax=Slackia exigua TaxID=84109 RepID=UPI0028D890DE|nr:DUF1998 domain-containing protein [Slackia exigua]